MFTLLYISAILITLLFGASVVALVSRDRQTKQRLAELEKQYADEQILASDIATFAGRASYGTNQPSGAGPLILTSRRLLFEMLSPPRKLAISMEAVRNAEVIEVQGGRAKALQVAFHDDKADVMDLAVWVLPKMDEWAHKIAVARVEAMKGDKPIGMAPWERDG